MSQILGRVQKDLGSIVEKVNDGQTKRAVGDISPVDYNVVVEAMAASYTTEEQLHNHTNPVAHSGKIDDDEVTFF